eukprot:scaffold22896_cov65-Skeletonema_dohrnii-CCMP3373.AAC.2
MQQMCKNNRCCCHDGSGHYTQPYLHLLVFHPPITSFLLHQRLLLFIVADLFWYPRYLVDEFHNVVLSNCKKRYHASFKKDIPLTYTTICPNITMKGEYDAVVDMLIEIARANTLTSWFILVYSDGAAMR